MGAFLQDVRYAIRTLLATPGFFLRALPVDRPADLVRMATRTTDGHVHADFSYPLYAALRDEGTLEGLAAYTERSMGLSAGGRTERIGARLSSLRSGSTA